MKQRTKRPFLSPLTGLVTLAAPLLLAASCAVGPDPDEDSGTVSSIEQNACEFGSCGKLAFCPPSDDCVIWSCDMAAICCVPSKGPSGLGEPCADAQGNQGICVESPGLPYPVCCAGCIDRNGQCQPGTSIDACGLPGSSCDTCADVSCHTAECKEGACSYQPQPGAPCSGGVCTDQGDCCLGCLEGGTCYANNNDHCGSGGGMCQRCGECEECVTGSCQPKANGDTCDDGDACTEPDTCSGGQCGGTAVVCNDNNECTTDSCDSASGCDYQPKTGDCNDGNACTENDTCVAGECDGTAVVCDDGNFCTNDSCDDATGCVYASKAQDTPCDDGNSCSPTSACRDQDSAGTPLDPRQCVATSGLDCNDNDPCTSDACVENGPGPDDDECQVPRDPINEGGGCASTLCETGQTCAAGICQGGTPLDCDDTVTCTADDCDAALGCTHAPVAEACNDGNPCTLDDACDNGVCVGVDVECAALDNCHQAGSCDSTTGTCSDPRKPNGATCGSTGRCENGSCVGDTVAEGGAGGDSAGPVGSGGDDTTGTSGTSGTTGSGAMDGGVYARDPGGCACAMPGQKRAGGGLTALLLATSLGLARRRRKPLAYRNSPGSLSTK